MSRRVSAWCLSLVMVFVTVFATFIPALQVQAAGKTVIVHYGGRAADDYEGWNLWLWEDGRDGQSVEFTQEDDFGKIAVYQTNRTPSKVGFIVRRGNWEEKDVSEDRFISTTEDVTEVWITSGEAEFATEAPDGAESFDFTALEKERLGVYEQEDAFKLDVHYYNFSQSYDEKTIYAYASLGDQIGGNYPMAQKDSFGADFQIGFTKDAVEAANGTASVKIVENDKADDTIEYTVDLSMATDDKMDVYIVEGNPVLWYEENEVIYNPVISEAEFSEASSKEIYLKLSKEVTSTQECNFNVMDVEGNQYPVSEVQLVSEKEVTLVMEEALTLSKTYTVTSAIYEEKEVSMSKILGSTYFDEELSYDGNDLGATYSKEKTGFKVWAPTATEVKVRLYEAGDGDNLIEEIPMEQLEKGVWACEKQGDLQGRYYTYQIKIGNEVNEAVDLYARTAGVNGNRGMILDLASTDPEGFDKDVRPEQKSDTDAIIYELHIRDLSSDASSGISQVGKYLGLTETGTKNSDGLTTGLDHIKELGVTHVQLMPIYDYATVDESKLDTAQFNWGYDPKNYNVPEGSYSSDPYHGEVRVKELKQLIQTLHENGIRVNMDVVYNHTFNVTDSNFQKTVPDYYYRKVGDSYTNGSGCGNEVASDRAMVRKYIVDSVVYWATEYHIDGFRFDLMAVLDTDTMNAVRAALDEIDPSIMVYGEGWTGGESSLSAGKQTLKSNMKQVTPIGAFNDDIRDGIKGNVFDSLDKGFVSGKEGMEESIKFGVVGATAHPQVLVSKNEKKSSSWASKPGQSINYASCHDNLTLWDKLATSNADDSEEDRIKMNKLSSAIVLTSQGVPFFQAGEEMLRSKPSATQEGAFEENSYVSPDSTNSIKWDNKGNVLDTYEYYRGLIAFRKAHGALRMTETTDIQDNLTFMSGLEDNVVAYTIKGKVNGETAENILVVYNANPKAIELTLPAGEWDICVNGEAAGTASLGKAEGKLEVSGISCYVLVQGDETVKTVETTSTHTVSADGTQQKGMSKAPVIAGILAVIAVVAAAIGAVFGIRKSKKK